MFWMLLLLIMVTGWMAPWWFFLVPNLVMGWKANHFSRAFSLGFLASALSWVAVAYFQDIQSQGVISQRLSELFNLPHWSLIYLLAGVTAGLAGALFCVTGYYFSELRFSRRG